MQTEISDLISLLKNSYLALLKIENNLVDFGKMTKKTIEDFKKKKKELNENIEISESKLLRFNIEISIVEIKSKKLNIDNEIKKQLEKIK
jgi:hypothetical protein